MKNSGKILTIFGLTVLFIGISLAIFVDAAYAGMPSVTLTDIATLRLTTISFFLFTYLAASLGIFYLWNWLRQDFTKLPKLSFSKAMALVLIWGLAFHLVLVMIAGTRELMTPKAWEKAGIIYQLAPDNFQQILDSRRHKLEILKEKIWTFVNKNKGNFPSKKDLLAFSPEILLEPTGKLNYNYVEGLNINSPIQPLAYEPDSYGQERMVLLTNGNIELLSINSIQKLMEDKK
ncbi:MAG: hypothetical protein HGA42_17645 [Nostocales cyanobacterium W4_Combined_metabat2_030]|nr:hypothetical protein [Nostocales cyanobacterium W4_Combined_metabat2_030]